MNKPESKQFSKTKTILSGNKSALQVPSLHNILPKSIQNSQSVHSSDIDEVLTRINENSIHSLVTLHFD